MAIKQRTEITMKPLEGFTDYHISDDGLVYTTKYSKRYNRNEDLKVLKPRLHPSGYLYYGFYIGVGKNRLRYWRRGHRLVVENFIGKIPKGMDVDHIDGDRHNNDVDNLRIVTHSDNILYGYERRNKTKTK